ncbi:MAG: molybdopterin-dependent oxidoreductase, partial [Candidatus Nanopelagicales bacterium]|nr:molybdopterin-dependent oxidoreductase [Candidatus Nanopelagicales bacterium]
MITMTGCQGINGGGWAHYVGQEKCRPVTGWANLAFGLDWQRPARQMIGTAFWYVNTSQWRYDNLGADLLATPLGEGRFEGATMIDTLAQSARSGWMPSFPSFNRNPLEIVKEARAAGIEPPEYVKQQLLSGDLKFAVEDPDAPENWPRVLTVWRANLLGSSSKGNEYFLKHLLGTSNAVRATPTEDRSETITWREDAPSGKLDLLVSVDFRMTSTGLFGDILLPAATWYEKHDLSSTDMHPYVHAFTPAIDPPWETKSDYDIFNDLGRKVSELADGHLGTVEDLLSIPLYHDTPDEMAVPGGVVKDWKAGEVDLIPGVTAPKFIVTERDYSAIGAKMSALGPLLETVGTVTKGVAVKTGPEYELLKRLNGVIADGPAAGRPALVTAAQACEAILTLSGTTNGRVAVEGFRNVEERTGQQLADLALDNEGKRITFADTQARPVPVITSPEWSGSEHGGRRYTAFTINVERLKPWHTLTGRQHFFLDHDWMTEIGEQLPTFRPPLNMHRLYGDQGTGEGREVTVRYLTPHSKWSIHSEYQDNLFMLSLSRGGPEIWMSPQDAEAIGVKDNEWIEAYNRNGVVVARSIVSHRMPQGTVYMYHAKDRTVDVPRTETSGLRGGIHNSLTRLMIKPTHVVGGYAQLSFFLNYLGPTGNQRDEVTVIRRRSQEVQY